eukprot:783034-Rhodomonas_salina.2
MPVPDDSRGGGGATLQFKRRLVLAYATSVPDTHSVIIYVRTGHRIASYAVSPGNGIAARAMPVPDTTWTLGHVPDIA